jgi:hypothetical protein
MSHVLPIGFSSSPATLINGRRSFWITSVRNEKKNNNGSQVIAGTVSTAREVLDGWKMDFKILTSGRRTAI